MEHFYAVVLKQQTSSGNRLELNFAEDPTLDQTVSEALTKRLILTVCKQLPTNSQVFPADFRYVDSD